MPCRRSHTTRAKKSKSKVSTRSGASSNAKTNQRAQTRDGSSSFRLMPVGRTGFDPLSIELLNLLDPRAYRAVCRTLHFQYGYNQTAVAELVGTQRSIIHSIIHNRVPRGSGDVLNLDYVHLPVSVQFKSGEVIVFQNSNTIPQPLSSTQTETEWTYFLPSPSLNISGRKESEIKSTKVDCKYSLTAMQF